MPQTPMRLGLTRPTPAVLATMLTLVAMFVATALAIRFTDDLGLRIYGLLRLDPRLLIEDFRVWTLLSYALLHDLESPGHLVFNIIALYFFGASLESRWGVRRFVVFMALAALTGGLFVTGTYLLGIGGSPVVGASAITMGLLVAWGYTFPDGQVYLFFVLPVRGVHIVYAAVAYEILNALSFSRVSAAGHFGGMLIGLLYGEQSPVRRAYLRYRFKRLQAQSAALRGVPTSPRRSGGPPLRVIPGGQKGPPKDKRWLN